MWIMTHVCPVNPQGRIGSSFGFCFLVQAIMDVKRGLRGLILPKSFPPPPPPPPFAFFFFLLSLCFGGQKTKATCRAKFFGESPKTRGQVWSPGGRAASRRTGAAGGQRVHGAGAERGGGLRRTGWGGVGWGVSRGELGWLGVGGWGLGLGNGGWGLGVWGVEGLGLGLGAWGCGFGV